MMLLTSSAAQLVQNITSAQSAPDGAGLRIAPAAGGEQPGAMELRVMTEPAAEDQVVSTDEARIFLSPEAAGYLDDKVLDAGLDDNGNPAFVLAEQKS
jgi:Fe-S cluster assembly iron-binding protein IscA